jgi:hypothetical protein
LHVKTTDDVDKLDESDYDTKLQLELVGHHSVWQIRVLTVKWCIVTHTAVVGVTA